jgi:hypothetical protein
MFSCLLNNNRSTPSTTVQRSSTSSTTTVQAVGDSSSMRLSQRVNAKFTIRQFSTALAISYQQRTHTVLVR